MHRTRLPVPCEPCRVRKIKCSRDGKPCTTCVKRGVPSASCRYAARHQAESSTGSISFQREPQIEPTTASELRLHDLRSDSPTVRSASPLPARAPSGPVPMGRSASVLSSRSRQVHLERSASVTSIRGAVDDGLVDRSSSSASGKTKGNVSPAVRSATSSTAKNLSDNVPTDRPGTSLSGITRVAVEQSREPRRPDLPERSSRKSSEIVTPTLPGEGAPQERLELSGKLFTTATGHVRFVPSSRVFTSKFAFARTGGHPTHSNLRSSYPLFSRDKTPVRGLLDTLPPKRYCTELVKVYFRSISSLFHVLHDPSFHRAHNAFWRDPESVSLPWLALLFAVIGTAVLALPADSQILHDLSRRPTARAKMEDLSERYGSQAMRCLEADNYLSDHNVTTLQALVILVHGIIHSHGQPWTLLGTMHHIALAIGCHVDPSALDLDIVQCEERRRCWKALTMLYTKQNTAMGHIALGHNYLPSNCKTPADVNDSDVVHGTIDVTQHVKSSSASEMTYFLHKFRLYDLCADIGDHVLGSDAPDIAVIELFDAQIGQEQAAWKAKYTTQSDKEAISAQHLAHINLLQGYADYLTLLLHHRNALATPSDGNGDESSEWSIRRCLDSAKRILEIRANFYRSRVLAPWSWHERGQGCFHAFYACVLLMTLGRPRDEDTSNRVRECLVRFQAMADVSAVCARAAPVMQQLIKDFEKPSEKRAGKEREVPGPPPQPPPKGPLPPLPSGEKAPKSSYLNIWPGQKPKRSDSKKAAPVDVDWTALISEIEPQQWLVPSALPWEQWGSLLDHGRS